MEHNSYGSGQPQFDIETPGYEFRYRYNIPVEFRKRVCTCERINYKNMKTPWACGTCGKPPVHFLFRCIICEKIFIKYFDTATLCNRHPKCWDCINKEEHHCSCVRYGGVRVFEPLGLNPKEFTTEEMTGVFDFLE